tara:strand:+ start:35 stop:430 length:396 start_codon:yes stop_codon:yes gene_type:complete
MKNLLDGLQIMFFQLKVVSIEDNPQAVLVFAVGCAIAGITAVILDLAFFTIRGKSLLKLKHGSNTFIFLLAWAFGSFIMGFIGQMAKIFQVSLIACLLVGFTWPILFTELLNKLREKEIEEEPEQLMGEEV